MTTASQAKSKKTNKPLIGKVIEKKTQCALHLVLTVQRTTKKQKCLAKSKPYTLHTPMYLLTYTRNQPVVLVHAISFQDVSEETKQGF